MLHRKLVFASLALGWVVVAPTFARAIVVGDLVVTPASASVAPGGQVTFTANCPGPCTWFLGVNASGGSIDTAGHYTAGQVATATDDIVEAAYQGFSGSATVHVVPGLVASHGGGGCATGGGSGTLLGLLGLVGLFLFATRRRPSGSVKTAGR